MKLEEMKVVDVIKSDLYIQKLSDIMAEAERTHNIMHFAGMRTMVDRLAGRNCWDASTLAILYEKAIDKQLKGFSAAERRYILNIGRKAFDKAMQELIAKQEEDKKPAGE